MRLQKIQALCFGVFLLPALPSSGAALLIDDFGAPSGYLYTAGGTSDNTGPSVPSGTIAGGRVAYVGANNIAPEVSVYSYTDIAQFPSTYAHIYRDGTTSAGTSAHRITWTPGAAYDLLNLSGSSSTATLTFVLAVHAASSSQYCSIKVWQGSDYATYGATVSGAGDASFTYVGVSGTPNLNAVTGIEFSTTLPSGAAPSFEFSGLTAVGDLSPVPEPSEWAAISFGVLGIVWVAKRRFMPARA